MTGTLTRGDDWENAPLNQRHRIWEVETNERPQTYPGNPAPKAGGGGEGILGSGEGSWQTHPRPAHELKRRRGSQVWMKRNHRTASCTEYFVEREGSAPRSRNATDVCISQEGFPPPRSRGDERREARSERRAWIAGVGGRTSGGMAGFARGRLDSFCLPSSEATRRRPAHLIQAWALHPWECRGHAGHSSHLGLISGCQWATCRSQSWLASFHCLGGLGAWGGLRARKNRNPCEGDEIPPARPSVDGAGADLNAPQLWAWIGC